MKNFYVTTPIYYVNDKPHIGHAYTTILADVLARCHRQLGIPSHFLTGTDEHGQKVQRAAEQNNLTPLEQCNQTVVRFQELWKKLEISHDDFIRTTEKRHTKIVQKILQDLYDKGEIYAAEYEGKYCVPCERFFTEKDLVDGACPDCNRPVEPLKEKSYFFKMSKYQDWLIQYIETHPEFIQPSFRRNETLGFLRAPLGDLCISRPKNRLSWGIELPFDTDYVCYVWFDALVNYISAIGYLSDDPEMQKKFNDTWPATCQLIGKDILTTHTVYWPTMLKAMNVPMPTTIFAHGWWLVGNSKMSKSLGNVVNPMEMCDRYGIDAFRYFLMSEMSLGKDASFTEEIFVTRYNSDLANDLGNMCSRVLKMITANLNGLTPEKPANVTEDDRELIDTTLKAISSMTKSIHGMTLDQGIADVLSAVRAANRYFEKTAPWKLAKDPEKQDDLKRVLYNACECLRIVSALLLPIMPEKMAELRRAIGLNQDEIYAQIEESFGNLPANRAIENIKPLFPRIEIPKEEATQEKKKTTEKPSLEEIKLPENVAFIGKEDMEKILLKTAVVLSAEKVKGADKLLCLQIDAGSEKRQIVSGIAPFYKPEELIGKTIVIVANLKPAKLRGIVSQGMLLAASTDDYSTLRLVTVDGEIAPGTNIG